MNNSNPETSINLEGYGTQAINENAIYKCSDNLVIEGLETYANQLAEYINVNIDVDMSELQFDIEKLAEYTVLLGLDD